MSNAHLAERGCAAGEACGPCGAVCSADGGCPTAINGCGACAPLQNQPTSFCGTNHYYYCVASNYLSCTNSVPLDNCASTGNLPHAIGAPCGTSLHCRYACDNGGVACTCELLDGGQGP